MIKNYDVIIAGSGIAGLTYALKMASSGFKCALITKKSSVESSTNKAQGGVACVMDAFDKFEEHLQDTLIAGDGICDKKIVEEIVKSGPQRIKELIEIGVDFTKASDGDLSLGREGGHSKRRILHVGDLTGKAIETALLKQVSSQKNIDLLEHHFAIDAILDKGAVIGAYVLNVKEEKIYTYLAPCLMLCTGGIGKVYQYTTNPSIATGDGIAIAYRAGAEISNLEFIQFHPTAMYSQDEERFLISEAVRGEGAILRNAKGEPFMSKYDPRKDLAPRDIVARAIDTQMKKHGLKHLWLDITSKSAQQLSQRFPNIYKECLSKSIDISKDFIPVVPAAHYMCGGVKTDVCGRTNIKGLYACGETACTGLHGANRLASNSLLEALVVAQKAFESSKEYISSIATFDKKNAPIWQSGNAQDPDERVVLEHNWAELRVIMWDYVGIVRTTKRLQRAYQRIRLLSEEINDYYWDFKVEPMLLELRNMVLASELIVKCALARKESRGLHFISDYPGKSQNLSYSVISKNDKDATLKPIEN